MKGRGEGPTDLGRQSLVRHRGEYGPGGAGTSGPTKKNKGTPHGDYPSGMFPKGP